jgi:hypothetical protein
MGTQRSLSNRHRLAVVKQPSSFQVWPGDETLSRPRVPLTLHCIGGHSDNTISTIGGLDATDTAPAHLPVAYDYHTYCHGHGPKLTRYGARTVPAGWDRRTLDPRLGGWSSAGATPRLVRVLKETVCGA